MHIPIKVDYGVRALVDLAMHAGEGTVRASEIAARTSIPEPYLAQVLHALSKSGLVRSQRGPQGGHVLAVDPAEIRMSMVMTRLGSVQNLVGCLDDASLCAHTPACAQREVWQSVADAVFDILDSTTIADLVKRTLETAKLRSKSEGTQPLEVVVA